MKRQHAQALLVAILLGMTLPGCNSPQIADGPSRQPALQDPAWGKTSQFPAWAYDSGPEPTPMGKELININSNIPYFPGISESVLGLQKFRPA